MLPQALTGHCAKTRVDDSIEQEQSITIHKGRRLARWDQSERAQDLSIQDPERASRCGITPSEPKIYRYKIPNERRDVRLTRSDDNTNRNFDCSRKSVQRDNLIDRLDSKSGEESKFLLDRKSTRLNSSHKDTSRMPSSA